MTTQATNAAAPKWSKEEDDILLRMRKAGATSRDIAATLNGRSPKSVEARLNYLKRTPAQREARNARRRLMAGESGRRVLNPENHVATKSPEVPPEVWIDRIKRAMTPRSVTAIICGDPIPGYSALDRRI